VLDPFSRVCRCTTDKMVIKGDSVLLKEAEDSEASWVLLPMLFVRS